MLATGAYEAHDPRATVPLSRKAAVRPTVTTLSVAIAGRTGASDAPEICVLLDELGGRPLDRHRACPRHARREPCRRDGVTPSHRDEPCRCDDRLRRDAAVGHWRR